MELARYIREAFGAFGPSAGVCARVVFEDRHRSAVESGRTLHTLEGVFVRGGS
jgi:hypothetical protein